MRCFLVSRKYFNRLLSRRGDPSKKWKYTSGGIPHMKKPNSTIP